ncbi:MAG: DUF3667 domain-containing protein [Rhizobacter sp.]|nr:DUF3667 domain-containing protein [Rhizobacter sp.]
MNPDECSEPPPTPCLNCGHELAAPRPNFCPACGQETDLRPPTLGAFLQQFGGAYLSTEGALWRSLKLLLLQPGELTRQYLAGRRKHYVLPLRLYLTISVVTLLLVRVLGGVEVDLATVNGYDPKAANSITIAQGRAGMRKGEFYCTDLPPWLCRQLKAHVDLDAPAFQRQVERFSERFVANLGAAMFVLLPSFALWLMLAYRNRCMRYTGHLVFALHLHAFWFVALAFALPESAWLSAIAVATMPVYTMLALRRVYGGRLGPRLLRAAAISTLYFVTLGLAMLGLALWSLLR